MYLWCSIQIHLASNTCKAPEVLVLQIATIAPAHNLHSNQVLTRLQILGDVKLSSHLRILRIAHVLTIHPNSQVAGSRTYMEVNLLPLPVLWQVEGAAIRTSVVVGFANVWRIVLKGCAPGITSVLIDLVAIALNLKQARNRKIHPLRIVVLQGIESLRRILMVLYEIELPLTLHREVAIALFFVALSFVLVFEGKEVCPTRFAILLVHTGISPHGCFLCTRHRECTTHT